MCQVVIRITYDRLRVLTLMSVLSLGKILVAMAVGVLMFEAAMSASVKMDTY